MANGSESSEPPPSETQSRKSSASNLARVRDNQRRSRARRKQYLTELETKLREAEQLGVEASAEMQSAARRVLEDNFRLRAFLRHLGKTDQEIDAFTAPDATEQTESEAVRNLTAQLSTKHFPAARRPSHTSQDDESRWYNQMEVNPLFRGAGLAQGIGAGFDPYEKPSYQRAVYEMGSNQQRLYQTEPAYTPYTTGIPSDTIYDYTEPGFSK